MNHSKEFTKVSLGAQAIKISFEELLDSLHPVDAISAVVGGLTAAVMHIEDGDLEKTIECIEPCGDPGCNCHERRKEFVQFLIRARAYGRAMTARQRQRN